MLNYDMLRNLLNCSIVLIPIVAFFHNFNTQTFLFASTLQETINLESIFCRNPQSYSKSELFHCSSTRKLFLTLKDDCVRKPRVNVRKREVSLNASVELDRVSVDSVVESEVSKTTSFVEIMVVTLLFVSAVISLVELYKERLRRRNQTGAGGGTTGDGKTVDRRMSLVDLTVSRHTRKRESQLENLRTNSNTTNVRAPPPLVRRMSFPAQVPDTPRGRHPAPMRQQSWCASQNHATSNRKMSVDLSEDDSSPDRRRVRIIRRH